MRKLRIFASPGHSKMNALIWALSILIITADQITKEFLSQKLTTGESLEVIKNVLYITMVHNTGAAFGIFKNQTLVFIAVSFSAIAVLLYYILRNKTVRTARDFALVLILSGAMGNLVDRLRFGYVIDFLDIRIWPVFNLADSAITVGTVLLIFSLVRPKQRNKT